MREVLLYGSQAKGSAREDSDIDIAVVCDPFGSDRLEENVAVSRERWDVDLRIETVCLHPEDFQNKFFTLAQEVRRYGIPV